MEECAKVKILFSQPNIPMFHHSILPWTFSSDIHLTFGFGICNYSEGKRRCLKD